MLMNLILGGIFLYKAKQYIDSKYRTPFVERYDTEASILEDFA